MPDLQGMKDLNLRDEARFQQAPQPDMVSSQVCVRRCRRHVGAQEQGTVIPVQLQWLLANAGAARAAAVARSSRAGLPEAGAVAPRRAAAEAAGACWSLFDSAGPAVEHTLPCMCTDVVSAPSTTLQDPTTLTPCVLPFPGV